MGCFLRTSITCRGPWLCARCFCCWRAALLWPRYLAFIRPACVTRTIYRLAAVWLGFLNFIFWGACASWLAWWALLLSRIDPQAAQHRPLIAWFFLDLAVAAGLFGLLNARRVRVRRIAIHLPTLPASWRGRTALVASDLHLGHVNGLRFSRRIAGLAARLQPDIIFMPGDFFDGTKVDPDLLVVPFRQISPPFGKFLATGNHDEFGDTPHFLAALASAGVRVLANEKAVVDGLQILGVPYHDSTFPIRMKSALEAMHLDRGTASILLNHVPNRLPIVDEAGVSLQLSGHTHAGQVSSLYVAYAAGFRTVYTWAEPIWKLAGIHLLWSRNLGSANAGRDKPRGGVADFRVKVFLWFFRILQNLQNGEKKMTMNIASKRFLGLLVIFVFLAGGAASAQQSASQPALGPDLSFPTVLYGAAYYNEYMPGDDADHAARLVKDVALMKAAGLNVVRMGESTWSLWEPEDGHFEYAWMDRVVDAMGKAGIKVILGTPTYSIPAWMAHQHPEILADRIPGGMFGGQASRSAYGHAPEHGHRFARLSLLRRAADPPHRGPLQGQPHGHRLAAGQRNRQLRRRQPRRLHRLPALPGEEVRHARGAARRPGSSTTGARTCTRGKTCPRATAPFPPATSWSGRAGARCA